MKKLVLALIAITLCISICSCQESKPVMNSDALQMEINIQEATVYISDANKSVIDSLYAMKSVDGEASLACFKKALELVKDAETRVSNSISSPNFISEEFEKLEGNYEETLTYLARLSELSEEEMDEVINLMVEGTASHVFLLKSLSAFSFLYEIRRFDRLPDEEAQRSLKDSWWKFGFDDDIQCPETIDKQDLYLIWAKQYFGEFDKDTFLENLQILREGDDLLSPADTQKEYNQKWTELIKKFIIPEYN